ncbi:MAG TPA: hypothetical protein VIU61_25590 [Kofleriaceae bacterium]
MIVEELKLPALVVWIPILDRDEGSSVPSASTHIGVSPQFFDGEMRVGASLAKVFALEQPVWDSFFVYAPDAVFAADGLPMPALALAQEGGVVIGSNGMPAQADQSRLPAALAGKAVVVGEQADFEAILRRTMKAYVER